LLNRDGHQLLSFIQSLDLALTIEARFLTNLAAERSHRICLEQTLAENLLLERSLAGLARGRIQNARLLNDIVYRRVVPLPE
jgi:hypothetical protein